VRPRPQPLPLTRVLPAEGHGAPVKLPASLVKLEDSASENRQIAVFIAVGHIFLLYLLIYLLTCGNITHSQFFPEGKCPTSLNCTPPPPPPNIWRSRWGRKNMASTSRRWRIRSYEAPTRIANAPEFVKGVVNLRGIIVPIVDMRIKLNLGTPSYDQFTVVIILNIGHRVVGMVVDRVSDVTTLQPEQIKPAPDIGVNMKTDHIIGLGTVDERMLILVDIDKMMTSADMGLLESTALAA
jgi:purine-binding chemotaxis protein CheW